MNSKKNIETFFRIEISKNSSKLIFFENSALKFSQDFNFGSDIIVQDINKVLSLKNEIIYKFFEENILTRKFNDKDYLEKKYFEGENFRKIKKKMIYDIVSARMQEVSEIILFKNINILSLIKKNTRIFFSIKDEIILSSAKEILENSFSQNKALLLEFLINENSQNFFHSTMKTVHFGWKKEAVPIVQTKKSIIARFFDLIFG